MPHHKSCKKRMRQSAKARTRNRAYRGELRSAIRELRSAEGEDLSTKYREVTSLLDRAASRGLIHKRTADRYKSRLARKAQPV